MNEKTYNVGIYCRLSNDDERDGESVSIENQELLCKGWFLPPNTYDCGSFVVNGTAVVGNGNRLKAPSRFHGFRRWMQELLKRREKRDLP